MKGEITKKSRRKGKVISYVTADEAAQIKETSRMAGLTVSEFIRRVCMGFRVESREDRLARLELLKVNADMGRLGGLLKQALATGHGKEQVYGLLYKIDQCQAELKAKIREL